MKIGNKTFNFSKESYVMGILNVTPDSFSDGGSYESLNKAIEQAEKMIHEGATILDIGGESTRPGHHQVTAEEEIERVIPVIKALSDKFDRPLSIDTSKGSVAKAALDAGASMINDVWGFKKDPYIATIAAQYNAPVCLMHNRNNMNYSNIMEDIQTDLIESIEIALEAGVSKENILLDPGIGFAKTVEDNLYIMNHLDVLQSLGYPLLLGTSRKSFIGLSLDLPVDQRVEGTVATTVIGYMKGCRIFRVHDVKENYRALKLTEIIANTIGND